MDRDARRLLRKMATPSRLAVTVGKDYMGRAFEPYPWMLHAEGEILPAFYRPGRDFFILNVPPQVGKSTLFGMGLCAWYLGMFPHNQVIAIGYAEDFMATWGMKTRDLMRRYGPELFGQTVSSQQDSKSDWKMSNGFGGMLSVGIGGGITGNPGHFIWIDDVIKTMEEAASASAKEKHLGEFDGAIATRFHEDTVVLITATRFAEDDLSGRLIARQEEEGYSGDRFHVISIPAIATAPEHLEDDERAAWRDELGRKDGEHLESTHSRQFYLSRKASLPEFVWTALYQQDPSGLVGGMFPKDKWMYWTASDLTRPKVVRTVRAWDLATTEGGGDFTVGSKMGLLDNGQIALLDRIRVRKSSSKVEDLVKATAAADGFQTKIIIEQEKAGAGATVVDHYKRILRGHMVEPGKITGSKEERATPYSIEQQKGHIWLPGDDKKLCEEWVDEHRKMMGDGRRPKHDDQVDTGAYCVLELLGTSPTEMWIPGEAVNSLEENQATSDDALMAVLTGSNRFFAKS